jgi:hypothetical protein
LPWDTPEVASGGAILYIVDDNMNIIKKNWIKTKLGFTLPGNVFDISPDSSIYLATNEAPFTGSLSFSVGKFDMQLNLLWQMKFESLGQYRYSFWGMEATNDNGIVLYGKRWNWSGSISAAYIIKFDSKGNLTWTNNIDKQEFATTISYPNPSSGIMNIDLDNFNGKANLSIYDSVGRRVFRQDQITSGQSTFDLSDLPSGMYIYKLHQGNKEISNGKWVKM